MLGVIPNLRSPDLEDAPFRSPDLPVDERVRDLLARMTLAEKAAQLLCPMGIDHPDGDIPFGPEGVGGFGWGVSSRNAPPLEAVEAANALQRRCVTETRLGIPGLFNEEALCGLRVQGATETPDALSQAATWDPELIEEMGSMIGRHMQAVGVRQALSPLCDVAADPRWGRIEETYGEDPYLVGTIASAFVRGLQGGPPAGGNIASLKHFLGYAASEGGRNTHGVHLGPRQLREVHALPFEMAIREGGARGVMCSYNHIDGVPVQASAELLTGLLRDELGFAGLVISDLNSALQLATQHGTAADAEEAGAISLKAGLDIELGRTVFGETLVKAVERGLVDEAVVDRAVANVLWWKFSLGLFEQPYAAVDGPIDLDGPADRDLARRVAEQSIVLLQNQPVGEAPLLPIGPDVRSIAVVGPNADRPFGLLGNYTYAVSASAIKMLSSVVIDADRRAKEALGDPNASVTPNQLGEFIDLTADDAEPKVPMVPIVTVLEGIRQRAPEGVAVHYEPGCPVQRSDRSMIDAAVEAAAAADIAIVVVGDQSGILKAGTVGESIDSADCYLPGVQRELVERVAASGTPTVVVMTHGRPFVLDWMADTVPAIVAAWFPGEEGGNAVARVLFGDVSPSGRAPVTFHRKASILPMPYNRPNRPGNSYIDGAIEPVFPFGHGLTYSAFDYAGLVIEPERPATNGAVSIGCTVTNTGPRRASEVVQLYVHDPVARTTRPRRTLKGYCRVTLDPGESCTVEFEMAADLVALYDPPDGWVVEPGRIDVLVGASSEDIRLEGSFELVGPVQQLDGARTRLTRSRVSATRA
jgi:beta-glucosidase-like glycosyl hydrolase